MTALQAAQSGAQLQRATLRTSRLLDFCSRKELIAQTEAGFNQRDRVMTAAIDHAINSEKSKSSELPEQSGDSAIPRDSTA